MNEETFLKELKKHLKYLAPKIRKQELAKYKGLNNYNLNPVNIANNIYKEHGMNITINNSNFFHSISTIIDTFNANDKKSFKNIGLFLIYIIVLIIVIKIPFIYVRDMISNIFNNLFKDDVVYGIWSIAFELLYAITTVIILIKEINKKASQIEKDASSN